MAIPKFKKEYVIEALKFIDENGVPFHNQSTKYELVTDDGKRYPPNYVVAVADHLANGVDISTDGYNAVEAKSYLENQCFTIALNFKIQIHIIQFNATIVNIFGVNIINNNAIP